MSARPIAELQALQQLLLDDLAATSDDDLLREAAEGGEDVEALVQAQRAIVRETIATELRRRLQAARGTLTSPVSPQRSRMTYPPFERLKQRVREAFAAQPALGVAYREGREQTEADWQSLYEDLIELGAIAPSDDD